MAWWDWFLRSTTTRVVETTDASPPPVAPAPDAPRMGGYTFEAPTVGGEAAQDVAEVVREKAQARADRPRFRAEERGVMPVVVPSLRELGLERRLAALSATHAPPTVVVELWRRCTEFEPDDPDVWYAYGQALFEAERPGDAHEALQRARHLRPDDPVTLGALGFLALAAGDTEAALAHLEAAAALSPDRDTLCALAEAQEAAGRSAEANATRARLDV